MTDTYPPGMALVIYVVFFLLTAISVLEIICEVKHWQSISIRVETWSLRNPWFASGLIFLLGTLLAHFVLNPLPPS